MPFMFKIAKVSAFHKMQGAPTGPGNNVRKPLSSLCYTCKINLPYFGGLDFRFKITEVLEHIYRQGNKNEEDLSHHFLEKFLC